MGNEEEEKEIGAGINQINKKKVFVVIINRFL